MSNAMIRSDMSNMEQISVVSAASNDSILNSNTNFFSDCFRGNFPSMTEDIRNSWNTFGSSLFQPPIGWYNSESLSKLVSLFAQENFVKSFRIMNKILTSSVCFLVVSHFLVRPIHFIYLLIRIQHRN